MNRKLLIALLAGLGLAFVALGWWLYLAGGGKLHWLVPVLCTLLPVLGSAAFVLVRVVRARRGQARIEEALAAAGESAAESEGGGARRAEVERLRSEFEQAVAALKRSKLATGQGGAGEALYRLPWYAIIGPPASGKTTVLRNSGLKFPYLPGTGDRLKGIGGTRNCDWWLTNHAILLDTAGRWTLEEDDRDEWLTFLDLLKKNRKGRPLNGVIAAISLAGDDETSIAGASVEGVRQLATRMRERLDEIVGRLGVALPVYVLFTKCDLVRGFVETFGALSSQERRQIWGFTAPLLEGPRREPGPYFAEQLDVLRDALEQHALARMGQEAGREVIPTIYEFPAQLAALKEKLTVFVDELFDDSAYGETPLLRGAYFTSGTQESTPADLLLADLASALDVRPVAAEQEGEKKSYFLHDMLMRVVFEDRALATASHAEMRRSGMRNKRVTLGLFAGALALSVLPTISSQINLHAVERTRGLLARAHRSPPPVDDATVPQRGQELSAVQDDLGGYEAGMPTLAAGFGLFQGDRVMPALRHYHGGALKEWVVRPLMNRSNAQLITITRQLASLPPAEAARQLDDASRDALRDALTLHLLLAAEREACVPAPLARRDWLLARLLGLWEDAAPARSKGESAERHALLARYVDLTESEGAALGFGADARSVRLAREMLEGDDGAGKVLARVLERYDGERRTLATLAGASTALENPESVGAAFTREAWSTIARSLSDPESFGVDDEDWVFGCARQNVGSVRTAQQREAFQRGYLQRYEQQWQRLVGATTARTPASLVEAETMLAELASRPGVLGSLFARVKEQTTLPPLQTKQRELTDVAAAALKSVAVAKSSDALKGSTAALGQGVTPSPAPVEAYQRLERAFAELASFGVATKEGAESGLDQYRRQVEALLAALKTYRADDTKLDVLALAARSAIDNTDVLLRGQGGSHGATLRAMLLPPLEGVATLALREKALRVERLYCDLVHRPYQDELAGRYPMRADSPQAASLAAFQRFLQPGSGSVWTFVGAHLADFVVREGSVYRFGGVEGAAARGLFREDLLGFLNHAARVSQAFFPGSGGTLRVPFRLRVRGAPGYSLTSFRVGTTSVRYDSGVEAWVSAEWPGEQPSAGATLTVVPYQGDGPRPLVADGEWGLFRILDARLGGRVLERSARGISVGWRPKTDLHYIKVDFATDDPRSPLLSAPFGDAAQGMLPLPIPARIAVHGGGCG
ncbi:MAG: type VI secretion system membrane subunit TssM [Polyangiales bacterium]